MKQLRTILPVTLATALASLVAVPSAWATTLEVEGWTQIGAVTIKAFSFEATLRDTFGLVQNKCASEIEGTTSVKTGTTVSGPISSLTFSPCERSGVVVHTTGNLSVQQIGTTTNGTVRSIGAVVTTPSPFGTLTCKTAASPGTDLGTLTGVSSLGKAKVDIKANLACGISAIWEGTYTISSPERLGVTT